MNELMWRWEQQMTTIKPEDTTRARQIAAGIISMLAIYDPRFLNPSVAMHRAWAKAVVEPRPWLSISEASPIGAAHAATGSGPEITPSQLLHLARQARGEEARTTLIRPPRDPEPSPEEARAAAVWDDEIRSQPCPYCDAAASQRCFNPITGAPLRHGNHWQRARPQEATR